MQQHSGPFFAKPTRTVLILLATYLLLVQLASAIDYSQHYARLQTEFDRSLSELVPDEHTRKLIGEYLDIIPINTQAKKAASKLAGKYAVGYHSGKVWLSRQDAANKMFKAADPAMRNVVNRIFKYHRPCDCTCLKPDCDVICNCTCPECPRREPCKQQNCPLPPTCPPCSTLKPTIGQEPRLRPSSRPSARPMPIPSASRSPTRNTTESVTRMIPPITTSKPTNTVTKRNEQTRVFRNGDAMMLLLKENHQLYKQIMDVVESIPEKTINHENDLVTKILGDLHQSKDGTKGSRVDTDDNRYRLVPGNSRGNLYAVIDGLLKTVIIRKKVSDCICRCPGVRCRCRKSCSKKRECQPCDDSCIEFKPIVKWPEPKCNCPDNPERETARLTVALASVSTTTTPRTTMQPTTSRLITKQAAITTNPTTTRHTTMRPSTTKLVATTRQPTTKQAATNPPTTKQTTTKRPSTKPAATTSQPTTKQTTTKLSTTKLAATTRQPTTKQTATTKAAPTTSQPTTKQTTMKLSTTKPASTTSQPSISKQTTTAARQSTAGQLTTTTRTAGVPSTASSAGHSDDSDRGLLLNGEYFYDSVEIDEGQEKPNRINETDLTREIKCIVGQKQGLRQGQGLVSVGSACSLQDTCGLAPLNSLTPRTKTVGYMVGGESQHYGEWPAWVRIDVEHDLGETLCGGVLISDRHVLTAGHCFSTSVANKTVSAKRTKVVLGEHHWHKKDKFEKSVMVSEVCRAKKFYDPDGARYDYAVLTLANPVKFDDHINVACLPWKQINLSASKCFVIGIGITHMNVANNQTKLPEIVQKMRVKPASCNKWLFSNKDKSRHCFTKADGQGDTCGGDSGGPVLCLDDKRRWTVVGLVSYGSDNCNGVGPQGWVGVYTRVHSLLDMIQDDCYL